MRKLLKWIVPIAAVVFIALIAIPNFLQEWLWMRQLDYAGIFWTIVSIRVILTYVGFAFAFLFLWCNVRRPANASMTLARSGWLPATGSDSPAAQVAIRVCALARHLVTRSTVLIAAALAAVFASGFYAQWDTYLRFRYGGSYGLADPVFGLDGFVHVSAAVA